MSPKIIRLALATIAFVLAAGAWAWAHPDDEMNPGQVEQPETITLEGEQTLFKVLDLGRKGESRGDKVYVRVRFSQDGEPAGHGIAVCEQFSQKLRVIYCENENHILGRGTFLSSGFQNLRQPIVVDPILGGTGDFRNARGQATVDFSVGVVTIELLP